MSDPKLMQSNFADFFGSACLPVLEEVMANELQRHPSAAAPLFKKVTHDREIWQYSGVEDLALLTSVSEGADYLFKTPVQGYDKTFTITKYGLGFSISEEAVDDGKFNFMADGVRKLARSALETREQARMDIFNNGFSSETCADGVAVFSTSHTTPTGTVTIANRPSTDVDLSFSALSDALSAFKKAFRGDSGIYYMHNAKYLVVPTELELYAKQIVNSAQQADSANNNINPFHNDLIVVGSPHLTDSDAWFLVADPEDNGLRAIVRKEIESKAAGGDAGFLNDSILYKVRYREAVGAVNPFGLYGTTGA